MSWIFLGMILGINVVIIFFIIPMTSKILKIEKEIEKIRIMKVMMKIKD